MDSGVMDLCDEITALKAEIRRLRRLRAAASHVVDKSFILMGCETGELGELRKATRKLVIELDKFAPSMALNAPRKKSTSRSR